MSTHSHASSATIIPFRDLYEHVSDSSTKSVAFLKQYWKNHIENGDLPAMDEQGNTLLHLLASHGNANAISMLLNDRLLTNEQLRMGNKTGDTLLHQAAKFGMKNVAMVLFDAVGDHNPEFCLAVNSWGETPAYVAAAYGWEDMFNFLKECKDYNVMVGRNDGWTILHAVVMAERYDFALKIVEEFPELANIRDNEGMTALHIMASKPHSFRSGSQYTFINLGRGTFIPQQLIAILIYCCAPSMNYDIAKTSLLSGDAEDPRSINEANLSSCTSLFSTFLSKLTYGYTKFFTAFPAIRGLYNTKKKHADAEKLAKKLVEKEVKEWSMCSNFEYKNSSSKAQAPVRYSPKVRNEISEQVQEIVPLEAYENGKNKRVVEMYNYVEKVEPSRKKRAPWNPLIEAARNGIIELVRLIAENPPHVANSIVDEDGRNVLHVVAESKNIYLYEYLNKSPYIDWDMLRMAVDRNGNTIWHLAADFGKGLKGPKTLFGPNNFMTWDTFWFKFVKRDCYPYLQEHCNSNGVTAKELFVESHKSLREDATKEAKDMNQGLMLVAALVGTVNYSALVTIPGGYDQNNGEPIFEQRGSLIQQDLLRFMIYVAAALLASMFALGSQLAIQLSRFQYNDFFFSLSFKYALAMTSLFYATNFTVLACVQVFVLQGILKARWYTFFWWPCVCAVLVYIDAMYLTFNYIYFLYLFFCTNKDSRQRSYKGISKYLYEKKN